MDLPTQVWPSQSIWRHLENEIFCSSWDLRSVTYRTLKGQIFFFSCNILEKENAVPLIFPFCLVWFRQSAVTYIPQPARTVNPLTSQKTIPKRPQRLLLSVWFFVFVFVLKFWNAALTFEKKKKKHFSTISTMTQKFTWKWGRWSVLTETDRNQNNRILNWVKCNFIG